MLNYAHRIAAAFDGVHNLRVEAREAIPSGGTRRAMRALLRKPRCEAAAIGWKIDHG